MKTLLRTTALAATLALSAFAMTGRADVSGTCHSFCYDPLLHKLTVVSWSTTESVCCGGTVNLCPGTNEGNSFQPIGGTSQLCPSS